MLEQKKLYIYIINYTITSMMQTRRLNSSPPKNQSMEKKERRRNIHRVFSSINRISLRHRSRSHNGQACV